MKETLFCYGTLKDAKIQEKLFGRSLKARAAFIEDWAIYQSAEGYLFITPEKGHHARGHVLDLTIHDLFKADQWEEIPFYTREKLPASMEDGACEETWVYTMRGCQGKLFHGSGIAALDDETVMAQIDALNKQLNVDSFPFCDMYVMLPCVRADQKNAVHFASPADARGDAFLRAAGKKAGDSSPDVLSGSLVRSCFGVVEVLVMENSGNIHGTDILGRQNVKTYLSTHPSSGLSVVTLALPACSVSPHHLLNHVVCDDINLADPETKRTMRACHWLEERSLKQIERSLAVLVLSKEPSPHDFATLSHHECLSFDIPCQFGKTYELRLAHAMEMILERELSFLTNTLSGRRV